MTALGKLLRTTAFRLTLVYLLVFALFAAFLLGFLALNTRRMINDQIMRTVDSEIIDLTNMFERAGLRGLIVAVDTRSGNPGSSLYLVTTASGDGLAGNVGSLEPRVIENTGWSETAYRRLEQPDSEEHTALVRVVRLPAGFRLLVGRDLAERERLFSIVAVAGRWSVAIVVVLGLVGGFFVSRRVLQRIEAMSDKAQTIMAGDLTGRLPIAGTGDELDRLAANLNAMLERIEALMRGLKEVSDNVAHDLRTPLTRLRNRCEAALRAAKSDSDYRDAIEATIEESDQLIRVFDALLMIARAESGEPRAGMTAFDAAEIARDVGELYEPVADEKGLALHVEAASPAPVRGNRELIGQALANLLDNAIKYAGASRDRAAGGVPEIVVTAETRGDQIMLGVGDRGPGIPPADRTRAVERFVRLEQSRTEPGSGLGLSLASAVARLHGGELRLEDNAPGLRALLILPRADVARGTS
ncbi:MAG: ATP-binding protein [Rhodoplanes sp.]